MSTIQPYIPAEPFDHIRSHDWNAMQIQIRSEIAALETRTTPLDTPSIDQLNVAGSPLVGGQKIGLNDLENGFELALNSHTAGAAGGFRVIAWLPWSPASQLVGYQPIALDGQVRVQNKRLAWQPSPGAMAYLEQLLAKPIAKAWQRDGDFDLIMAGPDREQLTVHRAPQPLTTPGVQLKSVVPQGGGSVGLVLPVNKGFLIVAVIFLESEEGLIGVLQADLIQEGETTSTWLGSTRKTSPFAPKSRAKWRSANRPVRPGEEFSLELRPKAGSSVSDDGVMSMQAQWGELGISNLPMIDESSSLFGLARSGAAKEQNPNIYGTNAKGLIIEDLTSEVGSGNGRHDTLQLDILVQRNPGSSGYAGDARIPLTLERGDRPDPDEGDGDSGNDGKGDGKGDAHNNGDTATDDRRDDTVGDTRGDNRGDNKDDKKSPPSGVGEKKF